MLRPPHPVFGLGPGVNPHGALMGASLPFFHTRLGSKGGPNREGPDPATDGSHLRRILTGAETNKWRSPALAYGF
jgi:hypothetical protein